MYQIVLFYQDFVDVKDMEMASKKHTSIKPGQSAPRSGQYELTGSRGGRKEKEATIPKGTKAPPTPEPNQHWELVDPTKNKSGKG